MPAQISPGPQSESAWQRSPLLTVGSGSGTSAHPSAVKQVRLCGQQSHGAPHSLMRPVVRWQGRPSTSGGR